MYRKKIIIFTLFIILTPGFWWNITRPRQVLSELARAHYFLLNNISAQEREYDSVLTKIATVRWANQDRGKGISLLSKIFYNKTLLISGKIFDYLSFYSPRFYFQAGDGGGFSPKDIEPIPFLLFPFWVIGVIGFVTKPSWKAYLLFFSLALPAFILGQRTILFLLPVLLMYVYLAFRGFIKIENRSARIFFLTLFVIYSLYLGGREIWLLYA